MLNLLLFFGIATAIEIWDSKLKRAIEDLLAVAGVVGVKVPSAAVAAKLVTTFQTTTFTNKSDGTVFVLRKNFRRHMEKYLNKTDVKQAIFERFKGLIARLKGIARIDATNITTGVGARIPHMMTALFFDIGAALGLGCDGPSQTLYAVGDCNDHYEQIEEFMPVFIKALKTIFESPFQLEHEGMTKTVYIGFGFWFDFFVD